MSVRILEGDALTLLKTLPDQSVQMCCTSPPYFGLRDYGVAGQLGLEKAPEFYVEAMIAVFHEVRRVLRNDGTLWLNVGDSYAGGRRGIDRDPWQYTADAVLGRAKPKDLIGIPWMLAFALRAHGWYLRSDIIWHKPNPMPESVTDRPTKAHEYLFLLSKSERYYYDAEAIAEETDKPESIGRVQASWGKKKAIGRAMGRSPSGNEATDAPYIGAATRNKRSVWTISTQAYSDAHFATFPPKLIEPCILAGSARQACEKCGAPWERDVIVVGREPAGNPHGSNASVIKERNDNQSAAFTRAIKHTSDWQPTCDCENEGTATSTVLDPFGGAGTTGLVADRLGRNATLIELNPKYADMARRRIHSDNPLFGDVA